MSFWNTSHSIGAGVAVVLCGYLAKTNWRLCFLVPALIASGCALFLWLVLPDTPSSVGLPEVAGTEAAAKSKGSTFNRFIMQNVFGNPYIWLLGAANFFVYTIRYTVLDWGPTLLIEAKGLELTHAAWIVAAFEFCGLLGMLLSGWITDRYFGARGARTCVVFMAFACVALLLFWKIPHQSSFVSTTLLGLAGYFIYGPQCLVGIIAANLATKRAAASAVGLTGLFGYASTVLSGWGMGALVQHAGWDAAFKTLVGIGLAGTLLFAAAWKSKVHGYEE
jgi:OPA family glycerol-3-phosphate transporter-like MFS transporter/OPA family sugar phosphate sensor protein UhpC-like MFS transporter